MTKKDKILFLLLLLIVSALSMFLYINDFTNTPILLNGNFKKIEYIERARKKDFIKVQLDNKYFNVNPNFTDLIDIKKIKKEIKYDDLITLSLLSDQIIQLKKNEIKYMDDTEITDRFFLYQNGKLVVFIISFVSFIVILLKK